MDGIAYRKSYDRFKTCRSYQLSKVDIGSVDFQDASVLEGIGMVK